MLSFVNGIPTGVGRHARERPQERPHQGGAQLPRGAEPDPEGPDDHRRGHPRRAGRDPQHLHPAAAVPGADEGSAQQPRGQRADRQLHPHRPGELPAQQPDAGEGHRRPRHPRGARAQRLARRGRERAAQDAPCRTGSTCPASSPTAARPTRARASCSSSRATPPAAPPSRGATASSRPSCRCAARCSTPSRRRPARCCRTRS